MERSASRGGRGEGGKGEEGSENAKTAWVFYVPRITRGVTVRVKLLMVMIVIA